MEGRDIVINAQRNKECARIYRVCNYEYVPGVVGN